MYGIILKLKSQGDSLDFIILVRFLIGLAFGFALVKASIGFAGSVNKLYREKSSKVTQTILYIFILTSHLQIQTKQTTKFFS